MKKIEAFIKPFLLESAKDGLEELGIVGITVSEIKDFRSSTAESEFAFAGTTSAEPLGNHVCAVDFSPRLKLEVVVTDEDFQRAWECIRSSGKTIDEFNDELVVQTLSDVVRIRSDEHGECAI